MRAPRHSGSFRPALVVGLLALSMSLMPGCSIIYHYVIRGSVRNALDGTPIANATVTLQSHFGKETEPVATTADGQFAWDFKTSGGADWTITMAAPGFRTETLPLGHLEASPNTTMVVVAHGQLQPLPTQEAMSQLPPAAGPH